MVKVSGTCKFKPNPSQILPKASQIQSKSSQIKSNLFKILVNESQTTNPIEILSQSQPRLRIKPNPAEILRKGKPAKPARAKAKPEPEARPAPHLAVRQLHTPEAHGCATLDFLGLPGALSGTKGKSAPPWLLRKIVGNS